MSAPLRGRAAFDAVLALHAQGRPIVMLTAYDHPSARIAEEAGVDVVLVGDSAAMTVLGYGNTRDIAVDELLVLTRAVRRGIRRIPVVGDLPFGTYEASDAAAVAAAMRFADAGCDAVKLEGAGGIVSRARAIISAGIPVVGHVGLLPQSVTSPEGYRARGRDVEQARQIIAGAEELASAGCVALIVEAVPAELGAVIASRVAIPVIGIGAGGDVDGQVLVYHDLLGLASPGGHVARFVRRYASAHELLVEAIGRWAGDVRSGAYPSAKERYGIAPEVLARLRESLGGDEPSP